MKKLFLDATFAALCTALLSACGGDSGSSADSLDELSSSSEMDGAESSDSEGGESSGSGEGNSSSASEEPESSGSEGVESSSACVPGGSSAVSTYDVVIGTLTDSRDGQTYRTVKIGDQVWMAENLNYAYTGVPFDYNGDTSDSTSWCFENDPANCAKYGRLYTWAAAVGRDEDECGYEHTCGLGSGDIRGACPKGWHLPSKAEWEALIVAVDGSITEYTYSNTAGTKLKSVTGWFDDGNGEDTFGFSALPAGGRYDDGDYGGEGNYAAFWSSTENNSNYAYRMYLGYDDGASRDDIDKDFGFSVRCLMD